MTADQSALQKETAYHVAGTTSRSITSTTTVTGFRTGAAAVGGVGVKEIHKIEIHGDFTIREQLPQKIQDLRVKLVGQIQERVFGIGFRFFLIRNGFRDFFLRVGRGRIFLHSFCGGVFFLRLRTGRFVRGRRFGFVFGLRRLCAILRFGIDLIVCGRDIRIIILCRKRRDCAKGYTGCDQHENQKQRHELLECFHLLSSLFFRIQKMPSDGLPSEGLPGKGLS